MVSTQKKYFKIGSGYFLQCMLKNDMIIGRNLATLKKEKFSFDSIQYISSSDIPSHLL